MIYFGILIPWLVVTTMRVLEGKRRLLQPEPRPRCPQMSTLQTKLLQC